MAKCMNLCIYSKENIPCRINENREINFYDTETVFEYLPKGSLVMKRKNISGIDARIFSLWAGKFMESVKEET